MSNELRLGDEKLSKLFLRYTLPAIIGLMVMSLYLVVDGIFVGQGVGAEGLAAINIAWPFVNLSMGICIMIAVGGVTITAIELGKNDKERARKVFSMAFAILMFVSILISLLAFIFIDQVAVILGASDNLLDSVTGYLSILMIFNVFFMSGFLLDMGTRTMGRPNYAMTSMIISSLMNIILDYIFIMQWGMGLQGAALATGISQLFNFMILGVNFVKKDAILRFVKPEMDWAVVKKIFANGSSEFVTEVSVGLSTLMFNWVIMSYVGELGVSAFSIISYVNMMVFAVIIGISQGIQPLVSFNYGAENHERVKSVLKMALKTVLVVGIIAMVILITFAEPLVSLFVDDDPALMGMTVNAARLYAFAFAFAGINVVGSAFFTAIEKAKLSAMTALSRGIVFIVVGLAILPGALGINGIWLTMPFSELMTMAVTTFFLFRTLRGKALNPKLKAVSS